MDASTFPTLRTSPLTLNRTAPTPCLLPYSVTQRRTSTRFVVRAKSDRDVKLKKNSKSTAKPSGGTVRVGILESIFGSLFQGSSRRSSSGRQDPNTVFVAGASGRLGSRCVRTVVSEGFKVIAGARNVDKAAQLLAEFVESGDLTPGQARSVRIVPFDVAEVDSIKTAIGNAGRVVNTIGANESGSFKDIDGTGSIELVNAAAEVGVQQFVLVTALGTGKFILPASLLNLFGGVLTWKKRSEEALEKSGMQYTILRPGGMERPTDSFKETHNVKIGKRDTLGGGLVSRLQVAELVASCFANPELATGKCLEIIAETKAPLEEYVDLLDQAEVEVTQEDIDEIKRANAEQLAARAESAAQVSSLTKTLEGIQARKSTILEQAKEAKNKASVISKENSPVVKGSSKILKEIATLQSAAETKARQEKAAQAILTAAKQASREGRVLTSKEQKEIEFPILQPEAAEAIRIKEEQKQAAAEAAAEAKAAKEAAAAEAKVAQEAEAAARAEAAEEAKAAQAKAAEEAKSIKAKKSVPAKAKAVRKPVEKKADGPETSPVNIKVADGPETSPVVENVAEEPKTPRDVEKKVATPSFKKKPPVRATARMSTPPPKAAPPAVEPASSTVKIEPASVIEARVLAAAKVAAQEKIAKEAKAREAASVKEREAQEKATAAMVKAAQEACAKQAKEKEASIARAKAKIEEAAAKAAAAAAAFELVEKKRTDAAKNAEDVKEKPAPAAAPVKSSQPPKAPSPGFNLGELFSGFKAPWAKPTPEELELESRKTEVQAWISNWKSGAIADNVLSEPQQENQDDGAANSTPKASSNDSGKDLDQASAGEWIRQWRAKSLEKQLPSNKRVNK